MDKSFSSGDLLLRAQRRQISVPTHPMSKRKFTNINAAPIAMAWESSYFALVPGGSVVVTVSAVGMKGAIASDTVLFVVVV